MNRRYLSIWFRYLQTDDYALQHPSRRNIPLVIAAPERGRMAIQAVNAIAEAGGICPGMAVADARAIHPSLQVAEAKGSAEEALLSRLATWSLQYTPDAAPDPPDGLMLDITGCPHLWGGERAYLEALILRLGNLGYHARGAIADTAGAAWAIARYGKTAPIIEPGGQKEAISSLPPAALRLEPATTERLHKLGLHTVGSFMEMPGPALRRRFGPGILTRIGQALGTVAEALQAVHPVLPYEESLPCAEPIRTAKGIEVAIRRLLEKLCLRLGREGKGLRSALLTCCRVDREKQQIRISTSRPSRHADHLFKLFELKIPTIRPALGIELFLLEATVTDTLEPAQGAIWHTGGSDGKAVAELLDKLAGKLSADKIHRYLPEAHYWPERSYKEAAGWPEKPAAPWRTDRRRPICLLPRPEKIEVSAPIPDSPPLHFRYRGTLYRIAKADGPERLEQEWWLEEGLHRDYYAVEDESGARYWLFRSGHFNDVLSAWYLHGFFA